MHACPHPVIACHVHVFDPLRFPYRDDAFYRPAGGEIATAAQLGQVLDAHGVAHALIVAPNSGYGLDNRCLLDAVATSAGRFKGVALVRNDASRDELQELQDRGIDQPGFAALLAMARNGRTAVKLSSLVKLSAQPFPHADAWPFVHALVEAFTPDALVWASDWPFLRAPARVDYGPLRRLVDQLLTDEAARRKVLWDTPRRLFGFD